MNNVDALARLLATATFGTITADLALWDKGAVMNDSVEKWIQEHISKPMTSHREYFCQRSIQDFQIQGQLAALITPVTVLRGGASLLFVKMTLTCGVLFNISPLHIEKESHNQVEWAQYKMCSLPEEKVFGRVYLRMEDESCQSIKNRIVSFYPDSVEPTKVLVLPNISHLALEPIDEIRSNGGEFIYFDVMSDLLCDPLNVATEQNDQPIFGKVQLDSKI
ncbi:hypothetical protein ACHAW6_012935 [Cyclotella cf. meneghiniana]